MNERGITVMSNSKNTLSIEKYRNYTEMSESAFQAANRDFAKLFSTAGFSRERSSHYSNSIIRSLKNGFSVNGSVPDVITLTYSMSEKNSIVTDRFNMINREDNGKGSYIKGAAKGMKTINALYFKELKISINMRTGKIRIDRKKVKTIEVKTTVLVRGLNDKEAKNILGNALDYLNEKDTKLTDQKTRRQPADRIKINAPDNKQPDSYMSKLIIDLKSILENIRENRDYSRDLFESIVSIHEIFIEKNYENDDILKLTLDMITLFGVDESEKSSIGKKRVDISI
ncbi:MAG: hypothetical protein GY863_09000 [bacterium]|nr:hypothetical protein [bacterium]